MQCAGSWNLYRGVLMKKRLIDRLCNYGISEIMAPFTRKQCLLWIVLNFKVFLVPKVLVHCLYDAFSASILCTTKMGFQFWKQIKDRSSHIRRLLGMRKDFKSMFSCSSHGNLWRVGILLQEQNIARQFFLASFLGFPVVAAQHAPFIVRPCSI